MLYKIENRKGSQKTTVGSVSGGQGSWACKKFTVEVSVHRQVGQIRFYLNLVLKQIYIRIEYKTLFNHDSLIKKFTFFVLSKSRAIKN